jgi:hypothetical protein
VSSNLPSRIDRAAIERVIQRATELQTGERDLSDAMSPDEVIALGREVGIPERYLRQALLEERSRPTLPLPTGWVDRVVGPGTVTAQRVIRGEVEGVEQRLLRWMDDHELLTLQRQQPGRITWEPLRGVQAAIRRSTGALQRNRPFMLSRSGLVSAAVTALEPGFCHVALAAQLTQARGGLVGGALAMGVGAVVTGAVLAVMTPFVLVALAPAPLFLAGSWAVLRQYRPVAERTQLGLERALDNLERGEAKPGHSLPASQGLVGALFEEVRKALKP